MPKDYHLKERLGYRLSRLSRLIQGRLDAQLSKHELTRLKWCILSGVHLEGHHSPSDLADHIGITRPAISRLLKAMIADGLIQRNLTDEDGRARKIDVTDLGVQKITTCWPLIEDNQNHFLSKLSSDQRAALDQILQDIVVDEAETFDYI